MSEPNLTYSYNYSENFLVQDGKYNKLNFVKSGTDKNIETKDIVIKIAPFPKRKPMAVQKVEVIILIKFISIYNSLGFKSNIN